MKSLTEHLWFETPHRRDYLNITSTVEGLVRKSAVQEGLCLVNAMHITAPVFINDAEERFYRTRRSGWINSHRNAPSSKNLSLFDRKKWCLTDIRDQPNQSNMLAAIRLIKDLLRLHSEKTSL